MNIKELDLSIEEISVYLGSQVQAVSFINDTLLLDLYMHRSAEAGVDSPNIRLVMYAKAPKAAIFVTDQLNIKIRSVTKPLYLFAKAHLIGTTFVNIERDDQLGRVVTLDFVGKNDKEEDTELSIVQNLIPIAWNLSIEVGKKTISLNKPKKTPEFISSPAASQDLKPRPVNISLLKNSVIEMVKGNKKQGLIVKAPLLSKEIEKKQKLLVKLQQDLNQKEDLDYQKFAELLLADPKEAQRLYPHFFDSSVNIYILQKQAFEKHKKNLLKIERVKERFLELNGELEQLQQLTQEQWVKLHQQKSNITLQSKQKKNPVEARKFEISSDCVAYAGKSAQNNMLLLRQAKAWHYWMHIKDLPSSHVIIQCNKNRKLEFSEIEKLVKWWRTVSSALGKTYQVGDKVPVLVTQCRYVKAIKGDQLGRVHYSHEQVFTIQL